MSRSIYRTEIQKAFADHEGALTLRNILIMRSIPTSKATYAIDAIKKMIDDRTVIMVRSGEKSKWLDAIYMLA